MSDPNTNSGAQRWFLVHLGTQEVVELPELLDPEQDYMLDEDHDGAVWIFRVEPEPQPVMVDTHFDHHLLIDTHSLEQFVRTPKNGVVSQHAFFRLHTLFYGGQDSTRRCMDTGPDGCVQCKAGWCPGQGVNA